MNLFRPDFLSAVFAGLALAVVTAKDGLAWSADKKGGALPASRQVIPAAEGFGGLAAAGRAATTQGAAFPVSRDEHR